MKETELDQLNELELTVLKDNSKRAKTLILVFWVFIGLNLLGSLGNYYTLQIMQKAQMGEYVAQQEVFTSQLISGATSLMQLGLFITTVVVFLNWFRRAYGNLHRVGISYLRHKESMAVWAWFIPIVWFYRPVQIMLEIWTETQEKIKQYDPTYVIKSGGLLIGVWWTFFTAQNIADNIVFRAGLNQQTIEELVNNLELNIIIELFRVPEALLVILMVYTVSKMEARLAEEVRNAGLNEGTAPPATVLEA